MPYGPAITYFPLSCFALPHFHVCGDHEGCDTLEIWYVHTSCLAESYRGENKGRRARTSPSVYARLLSSS